MRQLGAVVWQRRLPDHAVAGMSLAMSIMPAEQISIAIARPFAAVYGFLAEPANFALWAAGLADTLRQDDGGTWRASGPSGEVALQFTPENAFGICDHTVFLPDGAEVYVPMRVIANGSGAEVLFTLFRQPDMNDATFARDAAWVRQDLAKLKAILEKP
jgi:hypothetical protein